MPFNSCPLDEAKTKDDFFSVTEQLVVERTPLAQLLRSTILNAHVSVEELSERTKVPRTTIRYLMGDPISAILPERVYLRGHLGVLVSDLGADQDAFERAFALTFPEETTEMLDAPEVIRFRAHSRALSAAFGGVALLSVVAAVISAIG